MEEWKKEEGRMEDGRMEEGNLRQKIFRHSEYHRFGAVRYGGFSFLNRDRTVDPFGIERGIVLFVEIDSRFIPFKHLPNDSA